MSTELVELKQELMIAKQQTEIMELRYKLQKTQAEKASRLDDSLLSPNLYEHYQKVAVMLSKSGVIPNIYKGKPEDIFVAMSMGYQLGFPIEQSLQDIAVVNGRPCLWGDGLLSLALNHPECDSINEMPITNDKGHVIGYQCTVTRKGHQPHTKQFTLQDATLAGLLSRGTVWKSYPERMLQMRARSFAIRDKFADALRGLRVAEIEEEDNKVIEGQVVNQVSSSSKTNTQKLKDMLGIGEQNGNASDNRDVSSDYTESVVPECDNISSAQDSEGRIDRGSEAVSIDSAGQCDVRVQTRQLDKIKSLFKEKGFSKERIKKAMDYYKVDSLEELDDTQTEEFLSQLEKAK